PHTTMTIWHGEMLAKPAVEQNNTFVEPSKCDFGHTLYKIFVEVDGDQASVDCYAMKHNGPDSGPRVDYLGQ
ncbi:13426_t:CDS:2, partial [Racocetra fulgida]